MNTGRSPYKSIARVPGTTSEMLCRVRWAGHKIFSLFKHAQDTAAQLQKENP